MIPSNESSTAYRMKAAYGTLLVLTLFCALGCSRMPEMTERVPSFCSLKPNDYNQVPVILVGTMTEDSTPAGEFHPARYNSQSLTRRNRVRIKVENVLQGDVKPGEIVDVFFFVESRIVGSDRPMHFRPGTRQMFFLQRDYGELRTITDRSSNNCAIQVLSGAHPKFQRTLSRPVIEDAKDLLLTRGEGTSDKQMAEAVYEADGCFLFDVESRIKRFQEIAKKETPSVRKQACSLLKLMHQSCAEDTGKGATVRE
jgi:hypothetical protein